MSPSPLITAVIPTFRRARFLPDAIYSALYQTFPDLRVCVYDNASGDETPEVVSRISQKDSRVDYFCHSENLGLCGNFNFGIQNVTTPFFSVFGDDDRLAPHFYKRAVDVFRKFPEAKFVCMATVPIDMQNRILAKPNMINDVTFYSPGEGIAELQRFIPNWAGIVFRRSVIDEIGLVDYESGPFRDAGYIWHAVARCAWVCVPEVAAGLIQHSYSDTETSVGQINKEWPAWWERMVCRIEEDSKVSKRTRTAIRETVWPNFKAIAGRQVLKWLSRNETDKAYRAAIGLGDCGYPISSWFLRSLVYVFDRGLVIQPLFHFLKSIQKRKKMREIEHLTELYKSDFSFLNSLNARIEK